MTNLGPGTGSGSHRFDRGRVRCASVLIAEDDDEMRELLHAELRADGHEVYTVSDGTEMLELLSDVSQLPFTVPDVIIMDVRMPGCSGLHILAALRAAQWSTPVILITAFGDPRLHAEAVRLGAAVVFDKPFDIDDLRAALLHMNREGVQPLQREPRSADGPSSGGEPRREHGAR